MIGVIKSVIIKPTKAVISVLGKVWEYRVPIMIMVCLSLALYQTMDSLIDSIKEAKELRASKYMSVYGVSREIYDECRSIYRNNETLTDCIIYKKEQND